MLAPQAADIVRVVGIGRNQYIDLMNQCKVTARTQNALESAPVVLEAETSSQSTRVLASASALGAAGKKAALAHQQGHRQGPAADRATGTAPGAMVGRARGQPW